MSTNYYFVKGPCPHCGQSSPSIHLGKSSGGWTFALKVDPDRGINSFQDVIGWLQKELSHPVAIDVQCGIEDEYSRKLSLQEFIEVVADRQNPKVIKDGWDSFNTTLHRISYENEAHFHEVNHSMRGPNGLLRRKIDGEHCIGHGEGTWDLCVGEYS